MFIPFALFYCVISHWILVFCVYFSLQIWGNFWYYRISFPFRETLIPILNALRNYATNTLEVYYPLTGLVTLILIFIASYWIFKIKSAPPQANSHSSNM